MSDGNGGPRIGSLFSGSGMLDEGVRAVIGGTVAWHVENDPAASKVLAYRYPGVPNHGDIAAAGWDSVEPVDVITGGFPCTDLSHAGGRLGLGPDTRSGLWSRMADAINHLRPSLVVIENVRGLLSAKAACDVEPCPWCLGDRGGGPPLRALAAVLADLAQLGFDAEWIGLRASDVGAAHPRFRVFILAWPAATDSVRLRPQRVERGPAEAGVRRRPADQGGAPTVRTRAATLKTDWGEHEPAIRRWERILGRPAPSPVGVGAKGGAKLSAEFDEWLMGWPEGWASDVPGVTWNDVLTMCGNGVMPQQSAAAVQLLLARARQPLTDERPGLNGDRAAKLTTPKITGRADDYDGDLLEGWAS